MAFIMEGGRWKEATEKLKQKLGKLRYPILILLLGVILLLVPGKNRTEEVAKTVPTEKEVGDSDALSVEESRLSSLLSQVEGAGQVKVMLSLSSGSETIYQTDINSTMISGDQSETHIEETTLLYDVGSGTQAPLIRKQSAPVYQGALILCQGADDPAVRLALTQAVSGLTGLGADRITVVKMN